MFGDKLSHYHFGIDHPFGPKRYWVFKDKFEQRQPDKQVKLCKPGNVQRGSVYLMIAVLQLNTCDNNITFNVLLM